MDDVALKGLIKKIKELAAEEAKRRAALWERGRNGAEDGFRAYTQTY